MFSWTNTTYAIHNVTYVTVYRIDINRIETDGKGNICKQNPESN